MLASCGETEKRSCRNSSRGEAACDEGQLRESEPCGIFLDSDLAEKKFRQERAPEKRHRDASSVPIK